MTGDRALLGSSFVKVDIPVAGISGSLRATHVGFSHVALSTGAVLAVRRMFFVPGLPRTLLCNSALVDAGYTLRSSTKWSGSRDGQNLTHISNNTDSSFSFYIPSVDNLYSFFGRRSSGAVAMPAKITLAGKGLVDYRGDPLTFQELIHRRCCHISVGSEHVRRALSQAFPRVKFSVHDMPPCDACIYSKSRRRRSKGMRRRRATRPLARVHFDLGFSSVPGLQGQVGFLLAVDEFTEKVFVRFILRKSDTFALLSELRAEMENHFANKIGEINSPSDDSRDDATQAHKLAGLRSDSSAENMDSAVSEWCKLAGIRHEFSAPYSQWQNGLAERLIGVCWNGSEATRKAAQAPPRYWPLSLLNFVWIRNQLPTITSDRSPDERWWNVTVPLADRLRRARVWGCKAFLHVDKSIRKKTDDKARACILVGHSSVTNGYLLLDPATGEFLVGTSVEFDEGRFPFSEFDKEVREANTDVEGADDVNLAYRLLSTPPGLVPTSVAAAPAPSSPAPLTYGVSKLVGHRVRKELGDDGNLTGFLCEEYRVRWEHYDASSDTWEPSSMLEASAPDALAEYQGRCAVSLQRRRSRVRFQTGLPFRPVLSPPLATTVPVSSTPVLVSPPAPSSPAPTAAPAPTRLPAPHSPSLSPLSSPSLPPPPLEPATPAPLPAAVVPSPPPSLSPPLAVTRPQRQRSAPDYFVPGSANAADLGPRITALSAKVSASSSPDVIFHSGDGSVHLPSFSTNARVLARVAATASRPHLTDAHVARLRRRIELLEQAALAPSLRAASAQVSLRLPNSFAEAMTDINSDSWWAAMRRELDACASFGTWKLVSPPPSSRTLGCRWVFTVKRDALNRFKKCKARLCVQGFTQRQGLDYDETFSPTGRLRVLRYLLAEASADSSVQTAQWDCTNAFLHADIDHDVYVKQPPGFEDSTGRLCKLIKCLYGTKQAPRLFFKMVRKTLLDFGAVQAKADECLFIVRRGKMWCKLLVHVDDFCVTYNDSSLYADLLAHMKATFLLTPAPLEHFLGIVIERDDDGVFAIHQQGYIESLLGRLGLTDMAGADTPMRGGTDAKLLPLSGPLTQEEAYFMRSCPYRQAVGALFYLARASRWDIAYAAQQVARFMANPAPHHWWAVLRIYRYLSRTRALKLRLRSSPGAVVRGFGDSDWAGCPETRRSQTGWMVFCGDALVAWHSRRQTTIAQSSTEAEFVACASLANEVAWWRVLQCDVGVGDPAPTVLKCDNHSAVTLAHHNGSFERTKHFDIKYLRLREYEEAKAVHVEWVPAAKQLADVLTKNLYPKVFSPLVVSIMQGCSL